MQNQSRKLRRTPNACVSCRKSKIKCSGTRPCNHCQRRCVVCRFEERVDKVTVSERYLQDLRRRANEVAALQRHNRPTLGSDSAAPLHDGHSHGHVEDEHAPDQLNVLSPHSRPQDLASRRVFDNAHSIWTSPFSVPSNTIRNTQRNNRNWIWLAPSSTWSFTVRLTLMVTAKLNLEPQYDIMQITARDVYPLQWTPAAHGVLDTSGLPSFSHSLYLFETVKFHFGQDIRLIDDQAFAARLREFYSADAVQKANTSRVWFVQFLLVLAFGNAFLCRLTKEGEPLGSIFFVRAMSLMPEFSSLWRDSLLAIEVSALAGLYLYSLNQREAGHVYTSQAIRIAQLEGLHTQLPEDELGAEIVRRCRNLWWTLYTMDRHFSSSLGLPMSTQDSDTTTEFQGSTGCPQQDSTFNLHVKLYGSLSSILTTVYQSQEMELPAFLEMTRAILHRMAGHAQELEAIIQKRQEEAVDAITRETRRIMLLYHHCVIVATRPLLLSLLRGRLELLGQEEGPSWQSFLVQTRPIIATGINSAIKTIQILSSEDGLLEVFLPFDLEFMFAASIYMAMSNALFLTVDEAPTSRQEAHSIMDSMILKGNRVAELRKRELTLLETLLDEVSKHVQNSGLQRLTLADPEDAATESNDMGNMCKEKQAADELASVFGGSESAESAALTDTPFHTQLQGPQPSAVDNELLDFIGISSSDFISIIDQINVSYDVNDVLDSLP